MKEMDQKTKKIILEILKCTIELRVNAESDDHLLLGHH